MKNRLIRMFAGCAGFLFSGMALAHPGHGEGMIAGFMHPILGLDHLLAALAVGVWAASFARWAKWTVPLCFVAAMLAAAILAAAFTFPFVESGIALSLLITGLLIALSTNMKPLHASLTVGIFAVFHGLAHGIEMPAVANPWLYYAGFALSTALLHVIGIIIGMLAQRSRLSMATFGSFVAACGGWMLFGL
jgi:urease accessory protein